MMPLQAGVSASGKGIKGCGTSSIGKTLSVGSCSSWSMLLLLFSSRLEGLTKPDKSKKSNKKEDVRKTKVS
jgi:hypothetical protein